MVYIRIVKHKIAATSTCAKLYNLNLAKYCLQVWLGRICDFRKDERGTDMFYISKVFQKRIFCFRGIYSSNHKFSSTWWQREYILLTPPVNRASEQLYRQWKSSVGIILLSNMWNFDVLHQGFCASFNIRSSSKIQRYHRSRLLQRVLLEFVQSLLLWKKFSFWTFHGRYASQKLQFNNRIHVYRPRSARIQWFLSISAHTEHKNLGTWSQ